jgi:hypothetical protein
MKLRSMLKKLLRKYPDCTPVLTYYNVSDTDKMEKIAIRCRVEYLFDVVAEGYSVKDVEGWLAIEIRSQMEIL